MTNGQRVIWRAHVIRAWKEAMYQRRPFCDIYDRFEFFKR